MGGWGGRCQRRPVYGRIEAGTIQPMRESEPSVLSLNRLCYYGDIHHLGGKDQYIRGRAKIPFWGKCCFWLPSVLDVCLRPW